MSATLLTLMIFVILVIIGVPIAVSILLGLTISVAVTDVYPVISIATVFFQSLDNYLFVAIPLFMMAGISMSYGGIARKIFDFSESIIGFLPGSLGAVNVVASMIFGGLSGSSAADVAGLGVVEISEMEERGYPLKYSTIITISSSVMAVIIPPSILLVIYASVAGVSVGSQLIGGLLPGILIGLILILLNTFVCYKNDWGSRQKFSFKNILKTGTYGFPALLAPVIILGGILTGFVTPTEASAVALVYCLIIGIILFKELKIMDIPQVLYEGAQTTGIFCLNLASGLIFANLLTIEGIPFILKNYILSLSNSPIIIMLLINLILLIAGMFLNPGFSIIIFTPLFLPIITSIGIHPIHFGVIMTANLALGLITPPVGACLYIGSAISNIEMESLLKDLLPFWISLLVGIILIIVFPEITMFLAKLFM